MRIRSTRSSFSVTYPATSLPSWVRTSSSVRVMPAWYSPRIRIQAAASVAALAAARILGSLSSEMPLAVLIRGGGVGVVRVGVVVIVGLAVVDGLPFVESRDLADLADSPSQPARKQAKSASRAVELWTIVLW